MWVDFTKEPLVSEHVSALESIFADTYGYTIFSDRQISGKTYPLHIIVDIAQFWYYNPEDIQAPKDFSLSVNLLHLSRDYYNHVLSVWECNDGIVGSLGSIGLGESVPAHSNVSTRAGIVAADARYEVQIPLYELFEQALH